MTKITFYKPGIIPDDQLKFAVLSARYRDKWVLCRHKERTTWEIPGGHREEGETIEAAARRELSEETGAISCEIHPVTVYGVEKDGKETFGKLFFAVIHALGPLDEKSEIGEIRLCDTLSLPLTYPDIQSELHTAVQGWLNIQSGAGELWDVYDENRRLTGRLHRRGDLMNAGDYHLVVHIWLKNSKNEYLLTRRAPNKGFPNMWETTGGSALQGDDSLTAALREVKEETGLTLDPTSGRCVLRLKTSDCFTDVWVFHQDFSLKNVILLPGETTDKMYADKKTIQSLYQRGEFVPYSYLDEIFKY